MALARTGPKPSPAAIIALDARAGSDDTFDGTFWRAVKYMSPSTPAAAAAAAMPAIPDGAEAASAGDLRANAAIAGSPRAGLSGSWS